MRRISSIMAACAGLLVLLVSTACSPQTAAERAYFEQRELERKTREDLRNKISDKSLKDKDLIAMVATNRAPDGQGTTEDWLKRQVAQMDGQLMFPRWKVLRREASKVDVQYSFSIIDSQNHLVKKAYQWQVDVLISLVGEPKEVLLGEKSLPSSAADSPQQRRIRQEEDSLE